MEAGATVVAAGSLEGGRDEVVSVGGGPRIAFPWR
jgi:hypothetical protein